MSKKATTKKPNPGRALCVAGGGQAGSRTGGQLYRRQRDYKLAVGTSVGAWIAALVNDPEALKLAGTTTRNSDIWKVRGVNKKDAPRWPVFLWRLLRGKSSWGNSGRLINLIKKHYTEDLHYQYLENGNIVIVCAWDHTEEQIKYYANVDVQDYNDFCVYIWASMSAPPAMSSVRDPGTGNILEDGGVAENLPLEYTVERAAGLGIREIDCYVHATKHQIHGVRNKQAPRNHIHRTMRALQALTRENLANDIKAGLKRAEELKINVWLYYLPEGDIKPRFYFIPELQNEWFNRPAYYADAHFNYNPKAK